MRPIDLYDAVLEGLPVKTLHPLHKAMMEECCERALENNQNITDKTTLVVAVQIAFLTGNSALQGLMEASIKLVDADQVTLNYRGEQFIIPKNSPLLKTNSL